MKLPKVNLDAWKRPWCWILGWYYRARYDAKISGHEWWGGVGTLVCERCGKQKKRPALRGRYKQG